jgi:membrane protein YqaA with SNARE-associated domain
MRMAAHPRARWVLAGVSFAESSFFPIPPDAMLLPMILANPKRAWQIAAICSAASVVGGFFGYAIGYFLFETIGQRVIEFYGLQKAFEQFHDWFNEYGAWVILIKGLTPIPYKIVTIASGAVHFDLLVFGITSLITRAGRFFLVAALLKVFGPPIREFVEKRLTLVTTIFVVFLFGGLVALKYL